MVIVIFFFFLLNMHGMIIAAAIISNINMKLHEFCLWEILSEEYTGLLYIYV